MNYISLYALILLQLHIFVLSKDACGPKGIDKKGVNKKGIRTILKYHNRYRLKIARGKLKNQPKGLDLYRMKWDKKLAEEAQRVAEKCIFAHERIKDSRFSVGQNLFMKFTSHPTMEKWSEAVTGWYREHKHYTFGVIPKKAVHGPATGHYTQVIWSKTYSVGCGFARYFNKNRSSQLFVCNYGPAGNIQGVAPYKTTGPNKCPGLCQPPY